jgi:nucleoid-associated protein YgaU
MTDLVAALAPLPVLVVAPTDGNQVLLTSDAADAEYAFPLAVYKAVMSAALTVQPGPADAPAAAQALVAWASSL